MSLLMRGTELPPTFAVITAGSASVAAPILRQQSLPDITVKRRIRAVSNARYKRVFDGIEMNVVDMARKVVIAANGVLPVSSLPQSEFAIAMTWRAAVGRNHVFAEESFDKAPSPGIV